MNLEPNADAYIIGASWQEPIPTLMRNAYNAGWNAAREVFDDEG